MIRLNTDILLLKPFSSLDMYVHKYDLIKLYFNANYIY